MSASPSLPTAFDKEHAAAYDTRFAKIAAMRDALNLLTAAVLADLPSDARILCVGAGTGAELLPLARRYPTWTFTVVEPSGPMMDICRQRAAEEGIADRCFFHEGYLSTLPETEGFHAATSILVSHFLTRESERHAFFQGIADRLFPGGHLVNADLSANTASPDYEKLLASWFRLMKFTDTPPESIDALRTVYSTQVAMTAPDEIENILESSGFDRPLPFFQTFLIRAWAARKGEALR